LKGPSRPCCKSEIWS